ALHEDDDEPEFEGEEIITERLVDPPAATKQRHVTPPRSSHLKPLAEPAYTNGHKPSGNGPSGATTTRPSVTAEKVRMARMKGYEGDPCTECGQLTLVRSGACCKCDTCGASSGCS